MALAFHVEPDTYDKVATLGDAARFDLCSEACGTAAHRTRDDLGRWIYPAVMPDGKRIELLKVLLTNACEKDCGYCANRAGRCVRRTRLRPEELARSFDAMAQKGIAKGLFLSSGIVGGGAETMEQLLTTVELVRYRYRFGGYVHLKLLPGARRDQVERAGELADRVSINLELPTYRRLHDVAPHKERDELLNPMRWASAFEARGGGRWAPAGQTTQFVVGAGEESDQELLQTVSHLYGRLRLRRAYYSAFQPVPDTPLDAKPPTPLWREHRLYQSDFLMRQYGFHFGELVYDEGGHLPREDDPKTAWARAHPECYPVEVNTAPRATLLRVPGMGPRSVDRVLQTRRDHRVRSLGELAALGAVTSWAAPWVLLDGRRPAYQLGLW